MHWIVVLENGNIIEEDFTENLNKINSFKIYTCERHNSIDLNTLSSTYKQHHYHILLQ